MKIAFLQKKKPVSGLRKIYLNYLRKSSRKSTALSVSKLYTVGLESVNVLVNNTEKRIQFQQKKIVKSKTYKQIKKGTFIENQSKDFNKWYIKKALPVIKATDKKLIKLEKQLGKEVLRISKNLKVTLPKLKKATLTRIDNLNKKVNSYTKGIKIVSKPKRFIWV